MPDYEQIDYIEQHRKDAEEAGLEWFWPEDKDEKTPIITKAEQHIDASQIDTLKALHAAIATTNRTAQDSQTQPKG